MTFKVYCRSLVKTAENMTSQAQVHFRASTLQGKFHLCIPFLGIVGPQSQFPHSCVYERFIYSQDRSTYFPAAEQADRSWKYINLSQIYECRNIIILFWKQQFHFQEYRNGNQTLILYFHWPSFAVYLKIKFWAHFFDSKPCYISLFYLVIFFLVLIPVGKTTRYFVVEIHA